jgi:hypothetical protein
MKQQNSWGNCNAILGSRSYGAWDGPKRPEEIEHQVKEMKARLATNDVVGLS